MYDPCLENRPEDITFLRICSALNNSSLDKRASRNPPLSFHFCLRLPPFLYDVDTDTATPMATSLLSSGGVSGSLAGSFQAVASTHLSIPLVYSIVTYSTTAESFSSPAIKSFFTSSNKCFKVTKKYYCGFTSLDSQADFELTFGALPHILPE